MEEYDTKNLHIWKLLIIFTHTSGIFFGGRVDTQDPQGMICAEIKATNAHK